MSIPTPPTRPVPTPELDDDLVAARWLTGRWSSHGATLQEKRAFVRAGGATDHRGRSARRESGVPD